MNGMIRRHHFRQRHHVEIRNCLEIRASESLVATYVVLHVRHLNMQATPEKGPYRRCVNTQCAPEKKTFRIRSKKQLWVL